MSKKIPSDVAEWTEYMKNKTGAVFFIMAAYTNADGGLSIGRLVDSNKIYVYKIANND